jgi:hypothetical protein
MRHARSVAAAFGVISSDDEAAAISAVHRGAAVYRRAR